MSLRIVFMGTPAFAVPSLQALLDAGHEVVGVYTQPDRPKGRGGKVQMSPVKELALKHNIPVIQPQKIRVDGVEELKTLAPDLCVTAAFGQILSQEVLDIPRMGTVNVHASLLPRHRGSAPVPWAILQGDEYAGVTTMLTDRGIDTGDMLLKVQTKIEQEDMADTLLCRLSDLGANLLVETIEKWEAGTCERTPQNQDESTYDPMLTKALGEIDLRDSTEICLRKVRAMNPWPSAYVQTAGGVLKIWRATAAEGQTGAAPGTILCANKKQGLVIATADGAMQLLDIQAPNAKRLDAKAYLLGHPMTEGNNLYEETL